ncbi:MAG: hypothetical protein LBM41_03580 [Ruminococcus sp.]|jgi:hypothetical protein|nr:hypothetical protein [Ruminococcus sp.]
MLGKVIKNDFKSQWKQFALLFFSSLLIPVVIYLSTIKADENLQTVLRPMSASLVPMTVTLMTFVWQVAIFGNDFNGKNAYLFHTIPVKMRTLIFSKCVFFYFWTLLSFIFALLSVCLSLMDFTPFEEISSFLVRNWNELITPDDYIFTVVTIIRAIFAPVCLFAFICAASAFGHLFGTRRVIGEILFVAGMFLLAGIYLGTAVAEASNLGLSGNTFYYFDCAVSLGVAIGFFIFTDWVYTKKINIL